MKNKKILLIFCILLFFGCAVLVFRPAVQSARTEAKLRGTVETFRLKRGRQHFNLRQNAVVLQSGDVLQIENYTYEIIFL